ncbi:hypothetical protein [Streptomyces phaeochromogenes]|uniref:hypothetical protein n=1 Tax=Streptomyces phaeochromogenes TaxID=1923 RepID=UPI002DDC146E|nr:hypothetical protein [Streptomyces phaeochromogenes]WRZ30202.1 hypothetical protein OG931_21855 [Streptomyces phaeochromogenes]
MTNRPSETRESTVSTLLLQIADRLAGRRPGNTFTATGRLAIIQATTLDPVLIRLLGERMPEIAGPVSRGAYSVMLRALAGSPTSIVRPRDEEANQAHLRLHYTPLRTPDKDVFHEHVHPVDAARQAGRGILTEQALANVHSHTEMLKAAAALQYGLRSLLDALDAEHAGDSSE